MSLSPVAFFGNLDAANPDGSDSRTISDDQHRNILQSMVNQCPNWTGQVTSTHSDVNLLSGVNAAGAKVLTGTGGVMIIFAYLDTPDYGWSLEQPDANVRELVIGPASGGGQIAGTDDPTNLSDTVNITINISGTTGATNINSHTHTFSGTTGVNTGTGLVGGGGLPVAPDNHTHSFSDTTDSATGTGHSHSFSDSDSDSDTVNFTPRYARGILMKLDV